MMSYQYDDILSGYHLVSDPRWIHRRAIKYIPLYPRSVLQPTYATVATYDRFFAIQVPTQVRGPVSDAGNELTDDGRCCARRSKAERDLARVVGTVLQGEDCDATDMVCIALGVLLGRFMI